MERKNSVSLYNEIMTIGLQYGLKNAGFRALRSLSCERGIFHTIHRTNNFFLSHNRITVFKVITLGATTYGQTIRQSNRIWKLFAAKMEHTTAATLSTNNVLKVLPNDWFI